MNELWSPHFERCGFILKDGGVVEIENTHPNPQVAFKIPESEFEKYSGKIATVWHTHTDGLVNLSVADYHAFKSKPEFLHMIVGQTARAIYFVKDDLVIVRGYSDGDTTL